MLELQFCVDFYLEEGLQIEDDPLEINNKYLWGFFYQHLLCDFLYFCVATFTKVIRYFLDLDQLIEAFLQWFHALHLNRKMVVMFQNLLFILAWLTNNLCDCLSTKQSFKLRQPFFFLGVSFNFIKGRIQELMRIFLNVCINRFSLWVFNGKAKVRRIIVLLLTQLEIYVHFLQLCKEIINDVSVIDLCDLFLCFKGHD